MGTRANSNMPCILTMLSQKIHDLDQNSQYDFYENLC